MELRGLFLQVGDVAFSVPGSLVVTLERVLGNETIGKVHGLLSLFLFVKVHQYAISNSKIEAVLMLK